MQLIDRDVTARSLSKIISLLSRSQTFDILLRQAKIQQLNNEATKIYETAIARNSKEGEFQFRSIKGKHRENVNSIKFICDSTRSQIIFSLHLSVSITDWLKLNLYRGWVCQWLVIAVQQSKIIIFDKLGVDKITTRCWRLLRIASVSSLTTEIVRNSYNRCFSPDYRRKSFVMSVIKAHELSRKFCNFFS